MPIVVAIDVADAGATSAYSAEMLSACAAGLAGGRCTSAGEPADYTPPRNTRWVSVRWVSATGVRLELRRQRDEVRAWSTRTLTFGDSDLVVERWRTIGFTAALMAGDPALEQAPPPQVSRWVNIDAQMFAGSGLDHGSTRLGAGGRLELTPPQLPLRFGVSADVATARPTDPARELDVRWVDLALGVAWTFEVGEVQAAVRAEGLAQNVTASLARKDATDRASRWAPGVRLGAEAAWPARGPYAMVVAAEVTGVDAKTVIFEDDRPLAELPAATGSIGVAIRFRF